MAKENYIYLIGQIKSEPTFKEDASGEKIRGHFSLNTIRRDIFDKAGNFSPIWDKPIIMSMDKEMIRKMENIKPYDIIEIKGTLTTNNFIRGTYCPHCNTLNKSNGQLIYINPVYINVRASFESGAQGLKYMTECAEVSNILKIIGRVCQPIETFITSKNEPCTRYQIAANRKIYVEGCDVENHTDYPWVQSYRDVARADEKALQVGSLVYIDGYIHSIKFDQTIQCDNPDCLKEYTFPNQKLTVTPYSVEYLENCILPESTHKEYDIGEVSNDISEE